MDVSEVQGQLRKQLERLDRDHLIEIELRDLAHLFVEPDLDPFDERSGSIRSGFDDLAATLSAARRLPDELTVRLVLPDDSATRVSAADIEAALRRRAVSLASSTWRDAVAVRNMGRGQLPVGIAISVISAALAYSAGAFAATSDGWLTRAALVVLAGVAITVAWVVSWIVVETTFLDWRADRRLTAVYLLLARASVEITGDPAARADS